MSKHGNWAKHVAENYPGILSKNFSFWEKFLASTTEHVGSLNELAEREVVSIQKDEEWSAEVKGPIWTLNLLADPISREIHYAYTSEKLASIRKSAAVPSVEGTMKLNGSGFYPKLECTPALVLDHFGSQIIDLSDVTPEQQHSWPLHDMLARCMVTKVLDADGNDSLS